MTGKRYDIEKLNFELPESSTILPTLSAKLGYFYLIHNTINQTRKRMENKENDFDNVVKLLECE